MTKVRLAVIGAGHLGRIHARLLAARSDVELVAVVDPVAEVRQQVAADCGSLAVADFRSLGDSIDAAVVATTTQQHHAVAAALLEQGRHVLVEKPLASTIREADDLVTIARRHQAILQVGHIERFNPALTVARPHLAGPRFIEAVRAGAFTARSVDIGVVLDLMIHDIDIVLSLVGGPLKSVAALGLALLGRHEDVAHARLEFANGTIANLSASRVSFAPARRQMQVWAEHAFADLDFGNRSVRLVHPSDAVLRHELDVVTMSTDERTHLKEHLQETHLRLEQPAVPERNALADELEDFIVSVRTGRQPQVTGHDGRDALATAEQILNAIGAHAWAGTSSGPTGPLATPTVPILRGPHWHLAPQELPLRREAG